MDVRKLARPEFELKSVLAQVASSRERTSGFGANLQVDITIQNIMIVATPPNASRSQGQSLRSRHASPAALSINNRSPPTALPSEMGAHQCSDRCLICLSRPDDYEDVARGMTCGMCSACGTARRPLDAVDATSPRNRREIDTHASASTQAPSSAGNANPSSRAAPAPRTPTASSRSAAGAPAPPAARH